MKLFLLTLIILANTAALSQNRVGIFYCASYTKPVVYDFGNYSKFLYNKNINNPNSSKAFYKELLDYKGKWDFTSLGCWILAVDKKRFNFYVTAGISAMGYHSIYDAGLSDNYPYTVFCILTSVLNLYLYLVVSIHFLTL